MRWETVGGQLGKQPIVLPCVPLAAWLVRPQLISAMALPSAEGVGLTLFWQRKRHHVLFKLGRLLRAMQKEGKNVHVAEPLLIGRMHASEGAFRSIIVTEHVLRFAKNRQRATITVQRSLWRKKTEIKIQAWKR